MKKVMHAVNMAMLMLVAQVQVAFAGADPFENAAGKLDTVVDLMSGHFVAAVMTVVLVLAGIGLMMNRIPQRWGVCIVGGALIIAVASETANFWLS